MGAPQSAATVRVSISQNQQMSLLVAEIRLGTGDPKVVMAAAPGAPVAAPVRSSASLSIRRTPLWSQDAAILDAALLADSNPEHLLVLDANNVTLYRMAGGHWQLDQTFPIVHARAWPRDLRGRIALSQDHLFDAYLPGVICSAVLASPLRMECHEVDDPWPLAGAPFNLRAFFSPTRNFFNGILVPGIGQQTSVLPFYSAAPLPRDKYVLWVMAGVDGAVHMVDGMTDRTSPQLAWGSDMATLKSSCGLGWQVLATTAGSGTVDSVRAYEIADREPRAVSEPLDFAGRITALWTKDDGITAVAVQRDSETGKYEAFSLAISCSQ